MRTTKLRVNSVENNGLLLVHFIVFIITLLFLLKWQLLDPPVVEEFVHDSYRASEVTCDVMWEDVRCEIVKDNLVRYRTCDNSIFFGPSCWVE